MKVMKEKVKNYEKAIKEMLAIRGLEETNKTNHFSLEIGFITLEQFQAGARILAAEILKR